MTSPTAVITTKQLITHGVTLNYTVSGTGDDTVILMHGWGCNNSTVEIIRATATHAGYRVINVDFPGHGDSTEPTELPDGKPWGVEEFTQVIESLAQIESVKAPVMIGHSFGGRVAIVYASRNKVKKVVLVDAAGIKPRRPLKYYLKVYSFKAAKWFWLTILGKERGAKKIEEMRNRRGSADYRQSSPMMRRIMSRVVNQDLRHLMPAIQAPTLLMWGEEDTATPLCDAKEMERLIPDAGLVSFAHCGHYSFLDNRQAFCAVLTNFLTHK